MVNLDFSKLEDLGKRMFEADVETPKTAPEALEAGKGYKCTAAPPEAARNKPGASERQGALYVKLNTMQEDHTRAIRAYAEYQANIRKAEDLKIQIIKGVQAGEAPLNLLLKACQCIGCMTGDTTFNRQLEKGLIAIYGKAFLEPVPLKLESDQVEGRLRKLKSVLANDSDQEDRRQIETAIKAHEGKLGKLRDLLTRAEETGDIGA